MKNAAIFKTVIVRSPKEGKMPGIVCVAAWFAEKIKNIPKPEIIMYVRMFLS